MSLRLSESVPCFWVLLVIVTFVTSSNFLESQLWKTESSSFQVKSDSSLLEESLALSVNQCTVEALSCDLEEKMNNLSVEQKQTVKSLYKFARKTIHSEAHVDFLSKCQEVNFIPKSFRIKNNLPGNTITNQKRIENVCFEAISDEKEKHLQKANWARAEFDKVSGDLENVFDESVCGKWGRSTLL